MAPGRNLSTSLMVGAIPAALTAAILLRQFINPLQLIPADDTGGTHSHQPNAGDETGLMQQVFAIHRTPTSTYHAPTSCRDNPVVRSDHWIVACGITRTTAARMHDHRPCGPSGPCGSRTKKARRGDPNRPRPWDANGGWLASARWRFMGIGGSEAAAP